MILAWQTHPEFPLIVVANRDEYHQRPSTPLHFWTDAPDILAGRDLKGGGTWLGVNRNGRWAGVTNYREGRENPAPRSRGDLTREFLQGGMPAVSFSHPVLRIYIWYGKQGACIRNRIHQKAHCIVQVSTL